MRSLRIGLATLLAVFVYLASTIFMSSSPLIAEQLGTTAVRGFVGVAYADAASDACSNSPNPDACATGYRAYSSSNSSAVDDTCSRTYGSDTSAVDACQDGGGIAGAAARNDSFDQNQCASNAGGLGWITCPIFERITNFVSKGAKELLTQFMAVQPLERAGPLYNTWSGVRLIANTLFVLIFLVIIFAHTLQFNLDAYALKKMIPKLAAAAILIQFSYVLASVIVDVGNILGAGVGGLIASVAHTSGHNGTDVAGGIIEWLLGGVATVSLIALASVNIILAGPVFIIFLIAILGVIVILAIRYFLIGVLIVTAPLALAAWVLPNTEAYFNKWLGTFVRLILMYPIIMALLSVAGDVNGLIPASASAPGTIGQGSQAIALPVIKLLVVAACFLMIPQTFKWAGGLMATAYNEVAGLTKRGMKAKWNSIDTQVRRQEAQRERIQKADMIEEGYSKGKGKYKWLHPGNNPSAFHERLSKGFKNAGIMLMAGETTDFTTRRYKYSHLVEDHTKSFSVYDEMREIHNPEAALSLHYINRALENPNLDQSKVPWLLSQKKAFTEQLESADAMFLTNLTGTTARREAMMSYLAKNNSLKPALQSIIQASGEKEELGAFVRQGFSEYPNQPMIMGIRASDNNLKRPQIPAIHKELSASKLKNTYHVRNLEVMAAVGTAAATEQAEEAARVFAENVGADDVMLTFRTGHINFMEKSKRTNLLVAMVNNNDAYSSGNGLNIKARAVNQILKDRMNDENAHADMLQDFKDKVREQYLEKNPTATQAEQDAAVSQALARLNSVDRENGVSGDLT